MNERTNSFKRKKDKKKSINSMLPDRRKSWLIFVLSSNDMHSEFGSIFHQSFLNEVPTFCTSVNLLCLKTMRWETITCSLVTILITLWYYTKHFRVFFLFETQRLSEHKSCDVTIVKQAATWCKRVNLSKYLKSLSKQKPAFEDSKANLGNSVNGRKGWGHLSCHSR